MLLTWEQGLSLGLRQLFATPLKGLLVAVVQVRLLVEIEGFVHRPASLRPGSWLEMLGDRGRRGQGKLRFLHGSRASKTSMTIASLSSSRWLMIAAISAASPKPVNVFAIRIVSWNCTPRRSVPSMTIGRYRMST